MMVIPTVEPKNFHIRSPHYRILLAEGAQFSQHDETSIAINYGNVDQETESAKQLGLADLSALPRTGFKGTEAINWIQSQNFSIEDQNNRAYVQENGLLIARLADSEVLVLNNFWEPNNQCALLDSKYNQESPSRCYSVPRRDASAWLLITGEHASEMFAKICGVDLRLEKFSNYSIAQTSIARINGIIIRNDINTTPAFHLVFDSASTDYMWTCLKDAFIEFKGTCVGYTAISQL